jgi:type II secretory pathway pseudopilin PulG
MMNRKTQRLVIAIIAVLVAIAIPVFNTQLERAREAHDVHIMRQAMTLAVTTYSGGIEDTASATAAGLRWWENDGWNQANAAGVYDPTTGKFSPLSSKEAKAYGKGTELTTGSEYSLNGARTAYAPNLDYTNAVVMVSIYPKGNKKHIDIYWKDVRTGTYIGGNGANGNDPKYSIRINLG